jgi:RNA polymerase sigma-70 factor, ECF subfamily
MEGPADLDQVDVRRVLAEDVDAFEGIVERWQRPLVNLAFRFCRHEGQAEEMAQDAFLRAFRFLHQWREEAAFSTWLFSIALNVFRSHMRRHGPVELPFPDEGLTMAGGDLLKEIAARNTDEAVRRTVSTLPGKYREAVVLFYFLDQNVAEAARCIGVPDGTFKARLHRGRELLRSRLGRLLGLEAEKTR